MKVLLLAGEESGVLYANAIAARLRTVYPDVVIRTYADYGFATHDLAVMGIVPILRHIFYFLRVARTMRQAIADWKPDVVCTVDYPGMNLKLAAYAKARGIRAVHVVCPQVWAWKRGRIPKIEAALDALCCFFPFEPALFKEGFATFVGHPLVEAFAREKVAASDAASSEAFRLAILPGSRLGEIEKILPTLLQTLTLLDAASAKAGRTFTVTIPAANAEAEKAIRTLVAASPWSGRITVQNGGARALLRVSDAAVVASGTATLEAALARCPTVLVYRVGRVFAFLARRFITGVRHIGLANVIAEKANVPCPMPELLQEAFTPEAVAAIVGKWMTDPSARREAIQALDSTMRLLSAEGDAIGRIVTIVAISKHLLTSTPHS